MGSDRSPGILEMSKMEQIGITDGKAVLHPKSPSELQPSFGSDTQSPTVLQPSSVWPIIPCFIISAYSFISLFLIPFPHAFHVSNICLFHVPHPQTLFHFASHSSYSISISIIVSNPMPISYDPDMFSSILICSEHHVCFLSLKST